MDGKPNGITFAQWQAIQSHVEQAALTGRSTVGHMIEGDARFFCNTLESIVRKIPLQEEFDGTYLHRLRIGRVHAQKPLAHAPGEGSVHPLYPVEAQRRDLSYTANITAQLIYHKYKLVNEEDGDDVRNACMFAVDGRLLPFKRCYAYSHVADLKDIPVVVNGSMCRVKDSGSLVHGGPEDPGGYFVWDGFKKVVESQWIQRLNFAYTHFVAANASSHTQSVSLVEALMSIANNTSNDDASEKSSTSSSTKKNGSSTKKAKTTSSAVLLACDFHTMDDTIDCLTPSTHFFLSVDQSAVNRRVLRMRLKNMTAEERVKNRALLYGDGESLASIIYESTRLLTPEDALNELNTVTSDLHMHHLKGFTHAANKRGYGEFLSLNLQNVKAVNLTIVGVLFLLGCDTRLDMIRLICPQEYHLLQQAGIINHEGAWCEARIHALTPEETTEEMRCATAVFIATSNLLQNQSIFAPSHDTDPSKHYLMPANQSAEDTAILANTPGTYEHMLFHELPFSGTNDGNDGDDFTAWTRPFGYDDHYASVSLDGWDRAAALCHMAHLINANGDWSKNLETAPRPSANNIPASLKNVADAFKGFKHSFHTELLPNLGLTPHWRVVVSKRLELGCIVKKMIYIALGLMSPDKLDDARCKIPQTPFHLIEVVERNYIHRGFAVLFKSLVNAAAADVHRIVWSTLCDKAWPARPFQKPMKNGAWPKGGSTVMDASGATTRLAHNSLLMQIEQTNKLKIVQHKNSHLASAATHLIDPSQYGNTCPERTHNDNQAGTDSYLTKGATIRMGYSRFDLMGATMHGTRMEDGTVVYTHGIEPVHNLSRCPRGQVSLGGDCTPVHINGSIAGFSNTPARTIASLRTARLDDMTIARDVGLTWIGEPLPGNINNVQNHGSLMSDILISGHWGALLRPVFNVKRLYRLQSIVANHTSTPLGVYPNYLLDHTVLDVDKQGVVRGGTGKLWNELINEGVIVYRDTEELTNELLSTDSWKLINDYPELLEESTAKTSSCPYTICDISFEFLTGYTAGAAPFHNATDNCRNSYATGMSMQSAGVLPLNARHARQLWPMTHVEPKTTLVPTPVVAAFSALAPVASTHGLTALAIHPHNSEDGLTQCRSDFGQFHIRHMTSNTVSASFSRDTLQAVESVQEEDENNEEEEGGDKQQDGEADGAAVNDNRMEETYMFTKPDLTQTSNPKSEYYDALNANGIPNLGAVVQPNDAIVGRVFGIKNRDGSKLKNRFKFRDGSIINRARMPQRVESIMSSRNSGNATINLSVRSSCVRAPEAGDKFCNRHGQKNVDGIILGPSDMPYTTDKYGRTIKFTQVRNPISVPSRQTGGENCEILHARMAIESGTRKKIARPAEGGDSLMLTQMQILAEEFGVRDGNNFAMYSPVTGQPSAVPVFAGYLDTLQLHHLARETSNVRNLGAVDVRTGQPTTGSNRGGGQRLGPLESLNKVSQGATEVLEQMRGSGSNPKVVYLCTQCGSIAQQAPPQMLMDGDQEGEKAERLHNALWRAQNAPPRVTPEMLQNLGGTLMSAIGGWCQTCKRKDTVKPWKITSAYTKFQGLAMRAGIVWRHLTEDEEGAGATTLVPYVTTEKSSDDSNQPVFSSDGIELPLASGYDVEAPPMHATNSPSYAPGNMSPVSPAYSPTRHGGNTPVSPAYSPTRYNGGKSPSYSPPRSPASPAYSPSHPPMSPGGFNHYDPENVPLTPTMTD